DERDHAAARAAPFDDKQRDRREERDVVPSAEHRADDVRRVRGRVAGAKRGRSGDEEKKRGAAEPDRGDQSRESFRSPSSNGARTTPRSVMIAVISRAGVTSNAGWRTATFSGAMTTLPIDVTSFALRSSFGM